MGDNTPGHWTGEVCGKQQTRRVGQAVHQGFARCHRGLSIMTKMRRPVQINQLGRRVKDVATEDGVRTLAVRMQIHATWTAAIRYGTSASFVIGLGSPLRVL